MNYEQRLVLLLSQPLANNEEANQITDLLLKIKNFDYVFIQIVLNKISNLAFQNLTYSENLFYIPKLYRKNLEDIYSASCLRCDQYLNIARVLSESFAKNNLKYAYIKGMNLQNKLYRKNPLRVRDYSDLDILINVKDENLFRTIVTDLGFCEGKYNIINHEFVPTSRKELLTGKMFYHQIPPFVRKGIPFYSYSNTLSLDINFTPFYGGQIKDPIETEELLTHTKKTEYIGENFIYYSLSTNYDLLQNCFHFYKDIMHPPRKKMRDIFKLISFLDIHEFVTVYRNEINWEDFYNLIISKNLSEAIYIVLKITDNLYGDLQLTDFLKEIKPRVLSNEARSIIESDIISLVLDK